ncbi:MAG: MlaD family protein [Oligoflexia bacterium]|nr:MlaD family protein [Oligoflexia bacterium]
MSRLFRIGIFTAVGIGLIIGFSIYVNDRPYWYRPCNEVNINVDDATGLRRKSPVKTLGLEIGYINSVDLDGDKVLVKVCITGPVKIIDETRAYVRSSGFLGDKFLELKPVEKNGAQLSSPRSNNGTSPAPLDSSREKEEIPEDFESESKGSQVIIVPEGDHSIQSKLESRAKSLLLSLLDSLISDAHAEGTTLNASREAELSDTVKKVGKLIDQLTLMVGDLREVTQQKEFKETIINLNSAMKHLEVLLRPQGKVMKNVDEAMESLKNTMASAEQLMEKVKNGEGTIGKFLTDPSIYEEVKSAVRSVNLLLGKAGGLKTYVDIGGVSIPQYDGNKAKFSVMIAPNPTRYYLVGITSDPRGRDKKTTTTTTVNGGAPSVEVKTVNEEKGLRITALFGKYFGPLDLRVGLIEDNGAVGAGFWFDEERRFGIHADIYSPGKNEPIMVRGYAKAILWKTVYVTGGFDQHRKYNGKIPYFYGVGLFFDDDDLKYLLAFK